MLTDHGLAAANDAMKSMVAMVTFASGAWESWPGTPVSHKSMRAPTVFRLFILVGRKMPTGMGRMARRFFHPVGEYIEKRLANPFTAPHIAPLAKAFGRLQQTTLWLEKRELQIQKRQVPPRLNICVCLVSLNRLHVVANG